MDIIPAGIGRGRGRGRQPSVPNGLTMDSVSPINPPGQQSSVSNGRGGMGRGRGRGNGRPQAPMPTVPAPPTAHHPQVELGSDLPTAPTFSEGDSKSISVNKPVKKPKSERRSLCKMWTYPRGIITPLLVLSMNEYLNTEEIFIPGEISIASFTLKDGMDLGTTHWTLVDPSKDIPPNYQKEVYNNATNFGLPELSTSFKSREDYQNYEKVVDGIEMFIKRASEPVQKDKDGDGDTHVIFCQREFLSGYTSGLDWLYGKAGKEKFPHKLVALEYVLVMLSHGGIRNQAERKGFGKLTLPQALSMFSSGVARISRARWNIDASSIPPHCAIAAINAKVQFTLSSLKESFLSHTRVTQYINLGENVLRVAGRRLLEHPHAFMGAFLTEGQAVRYLRQTDYTDKDQLACDYHQDMEHMGKCARFNVTRLAYTSLDVLLANYEIEPVEGHHFPEFSYQDFND